MQQTVEDAVGDGGVADLLVPVGHRHLRSENHRATLIAIVADLEKVAAFLVFQCSHREVVDQKHVDLGQAEQHAAHAAVGMSDRQLAKQFTALLVQSRETIPAGFLRQGAANPTLANAGGTEEENILLLLYPFAAGQGTQELAIQPARMLVVGVFDGGLLLQLGVAQTMFQGTILSPGELFIDQQREPLFKAQLLRVGDFELRTKAIRHAVQLQVIEFVKGRLIEHTLSPFRKDWS